MAVPSDITAGNGDDTGDVTRRQKPNDQSLAAARERIARLEGELVGLRGATATRAADHAAELGRMSEAHRAELERLTAAHQAEIDRLRRRWWRRMWRR